MRRAKDFVRHLPDSTEHLKKTESFWRIVHIDPLMLIGLAMLTAFGLIILYSAGGQSAYLMKRQIVFFAIAYIVMFGVAQVNLDFVRRWSVWLYLLGIVLLIGVILFGVGAKGAQRWISLGFFRFQPSEILKIAVPLTVAAYFSARVLPPKIPHVVVCLAIVTIPAVLIFVQPDMGTALMVAVSGLIGLFLAGLRWRYIGFSLLLIAAASWPMWNFVMHDYQKQRVLTLLDPEVDIHGSGWNIIQSKTAIGSGGVDGKGWLQGTQSQLDFLPESHTDFIIAVLAEEFGLKGVVLLLTIYLFIIFRGLFIAIAAQTTFSRLLAGSVTMTFFVYVFVNIGMVAGLLPIVGVPLPLVSLGGTSLVTLMLGFGLLMAIATEKKRVSVNL